jgi:two-component system, OmpR family, response regulator ResD
MAPGPRVLVVDDEPIVREVLQRYLSRGGFQVETAADGRQALDALNERPPDLVLLDLMLPRIDGFEVFSRIRAGATSPVIMLTARGAEADRVGGLEMGADDYVSKPFSPAEVVARVRAVLRRANGGSPVREDADPVRLDGLEIEPRTREVIANGSRVSLTPREFELLYFLATNPGTVFDRFRILDEVWDVAYDGDPATVTVHVRRLREKVELDPSRPRRLITVWGVGYRFDP